MYGTTSCHLGGPSCHPHLWVCPLLQSLPKAVFCTALFPFLQKKQLTKNSSFFRATGSPHPPKKIIKRLQSSIFQGVLFGSKGWCMGTPYHPFSTLWKIQGYFSSTCCFFDPFFFTSGGHLTSRRKNLGSRLSVSAGGTWDRFLENRCSRDVAGQWKDDEL